VSASDPAAIAPLNGRAKAWTDPEAAYGPPFWLTYGANASMMVAVSLLYRYSDFVQLLGGSEWHLGWIVGVGMVGSISMRLFQGLGIDRYGPKQVWIWSNVALLVSLAGHLTVTRADSPWIFVLRILFQTSLAGVFGASITYISRGAPLARVAEIVGTLGTSGFVGMMAGTTLGDWICPHHPARGDVDRLFLAALAMGAVSFCFCLAATRGHTPPIKRRMPPLGWLLRRYHPGWVLSMGVATGFGIGLPTVFLRPYLAELNIANMAVFFWAYNITAFITRISIRQLPARVGIRPMILAGLTSLSISMVLYLVVRQPWTLVVPALFTGIAHALLFPAIVAGGSTSFPTRFRGLGTTLMLAMVDVGGMFGNPVIGGILHFSERAGWPRFTTMFLAVAGMLLCVAMVYAVVSSTRGAPRMGTKPRRRKQRSHVASRQEKQIAAARVESDASRRRAEAEVGRRSG
jgi:MFS family permease